jgi:hypothetical protein
MKRIIILLCFFITTSTFGKLIEQKTENMKKNNIEFPNLYPDVKVFIEKTKIERSKISRYFVYYLRVTKAGPDCIAYVLGIIVNKSDLELVDSDFYTSVDEDKLLVSFSDDITVKEIPGLEILKLDSDVKIFIKEKLLCEEDGFIMGVYPGMVFIQCGEVLRKMHYENSDLIPSEKTIYKDFMNGIEMRKINEGD